MICVILCSGARKDRCFPCSLYSFYLFLRLAYWWQVHSTKFSTDYGYATSLDMSVYFWKEDIEDGEPVMTVEYHPVEYGKDYDIVNNPNEFELYVDGKKSKSKKLFSK